MARRPEARYAVTAEDRSEPGLRSAESRLQRFRRRTLDAFRAGIGALARPALAIGALFTGWGVALSRTANDLDRLAKTAKDLETTVEDIAQLDFAGELLGIDPNRLVRGVEKLDQVLGRALGGEARPVELFEQLGITPEALASVDDVTDRLTLVADLLALIGDRSQRTALRQELVGRGFGRVFAGGGTGIAQAVARADELGLTRNLEGAAAASERFNDAITEITSVIGKRVDELQGAVISFEPLTNALTLIANTIAGRPELGSTLPLTTEREALIRRREASRQLSGAELANVGNREVLEELRAIRQNTRRGGFR